MGKGSHDCGRSFDGDDQVVARPTNVWKCLNEVHKADVEELLTATRSCRSVGEIRCVGWSRATWKAWSLGLHWVLFWSSARSSTAIEVREAYKRMPLVVRSHFSFMSDSLFSDETTSRSSSNHNSLTTEYNRNILNQLRAYLPTTSTTSNIRTKVQCPSTWWHLKFEGLFQFWLCMILRIALRIMFWSTRISFLCFCMSAPRPPLFLPQVVIRCSKRKTDGFERRASPFFLYLWLDAKWL